MCDVFERERGKRRRKTIGNKLRGNKREEKHRQKHINRTRKRNWGKEIEKEKGKGRKGRGKFWVRMWEEGRYRSCGAERERKRVKRDKERQPDTQILPRKRGREWNTVKEEGKKKIHNVWSTKRETEGETNIKRKRKREREMHIKRKKRERRRRT
jgi:hypothetical protein